MTPSNPNPTRTVASSAAPEEAQSSTSMGFVEIRNREQMLTHAGAAQMQLTQNSTLSRVRRTLMRSNAPNFNISLRELVLLWEDVTSLLEPLSLSWQQRYDALWARFDPINLKASLELFHGANAMWSAYYSEVPSLKNALLNAFNEPLSPAMVATVLLCLKFANIQEFVEGDETKFSEPEYQAILNHIRPYCDANDIVASLSLAFLMLNQQSQNIITQEDANTIIQSGAYRNYSIADFLTLPMDQETPQSSQNQ